MKTLMALAAAAALAGLLGGCAWAQSPVTGFVYTNVKAPMVVSSNERGSKMGTAECTSLLGWIAMGDASIETAARNAGITRIRHVDYESHSILGLFARYQVHVYGD